MKSLLVSAATLLIGLPASAVIGPAQDYTIHQQYLSPRAVGMGNAFVAVADDSYALFYNPAALAFRQDSEMNFGVGAMGDPDVLKFYKDMKAASDAKDVQKMTDLLSSNFGKHFSARAPTLGWMWTRPNWGVAIIPADLTLEMEIQSQGLPAASVVGTNDTTVAYGHGWNIKVGSGQLAVGATLRAVYRLYTNKVVNSVELAQNSDIFNQADAGEGLGVDGDFGALYSFPKDEHGGFFTKWFRPTVGLAVRNVADSGFNSNFHWLGKNTGIPQRAERRFDVGTKFDLPDWWIWKARLAIDERDIGHENWTWVKGSHIGAEFLWKVAGWWKGGWRVGLNQMYPSLGFTGKFGIFQLDLATYGEEVQSSADRQQSRRYMAKASFDF